MHGTDPLGPEGYLWLRGALGAQDLAPLDDLGRGSKAGARLSGGIGPLLEPLCDALRPAFGPVWPTRVISFDKRMAANWGVPWHRDRIIAVAERADVPGFDAWTCKDGVWHCRPPESVLANMLFCRVFLDDVGPGDGGMEFAPASHTAPHRTGEDPVGRTEIEIARRGDMLVLDMRLVHRSGPAERPSRRRVLRVDCARSALPEPLKWAKP